MISMYSDAALEQPFNARSNARSNVRSIHARSEVAVDRHESPSVKDNPKSAGATSETVAELLKSKTLHDDSLDAARGMLLAVVLGLGCWMVIGGIVRIAFF